MTEQEVFVVEKYSDRISDLLSRSNSMLETVGFEPENNAQESSTISLVFVGPYDVGKSSIIKMLTGNRDIKVGADRTTEDVCIYPWNEMVSVVDTPGIGTGDESDDRKTYAAIDAADLIVYVVDVDLFDSADESGTINDFKTIVVDRDKADEMILVVNKMCDTAEGNTPEQQEIIREALDEILDEKIIPCSTEELRLCFLDVKKYNQSVATNDPDKAADLLRISGYNEFIDALNQFISDKQLTSRLTTKLYLIDHQLENALQSLGTIHDDEKLAMFEEDQIRRKKDALNARNSLQDEIRMVISEACEEIRRLGRESEELFSENCDTENLQHDIDKKTSKANEIAKRAAEKIARKAEFAIDTFDSKINKIDNDDFTIKLALNLSESFDSLPENVKVLLKSGGPGLQKLSEVINKSVHKSGIEAGMKLKDFSGSPAHEAVDKIGKWLKVKFKPYGELKVVRGVAYGGKVLSIFGLVLPVYSQIQEDRTADATRKAILENRRIIRNQFNACAENLHNYSEHFLGECINPYYDNIISSLQGNLLEIKNTQTAKTEAAKQIVDLQRECLSLIKEIHRYKVSSFE